MNENGDLKIPNPLHSYSGLLRFINSNIINKVININDFIMYYYRIWSSNVNVLISHIKCFRMSQHRVLN